MMTEFSFFFFSFFFGWSIPLIVQILFFEKQNTAQCTLSPPFPLLHALSENTLLYR